MDDAAVVHPAPGSGSLVLTIDVITPIVDDPRTFGAIAACNSVSDVYAMGGAPQVALTFVGWPTDKLSLEALGEVLQGVRDVCARARCAVVGGHTIADAEPKCGLAVVGTVDPARIWSHAAARAGDVLVLTKPLGVGIVGHAIKAGEADDAMLAAAVTEMTRLNDRARDVGLELGASSATDVTGFGLLGHLKHIVEAAGLCATLQARRVPALPGALARAAEGKVPGGTKRNLAYAAPVTDLGSAITEAERLLLADAQTSGGLLLCLPVAAADEVVRRLGEEGHTAATIGELAAWTDGPRITVR